MLKYVILCLKMKKISDFIIIKIDEDILEKINKEIETKVKIGMKKGEKYGNNI